MVVQLWSSDMLLAASVCKGYIFVGLMSGVCEAFSIRNGYASQSSSTWRRKRSHGTGTKIAALKAKDRR
jgi:hypothetical protein